MDSVIVECISKSNVSERELLKSLGNQISFGCLMIILISPEVSTWSFYFISTIGWEGGGGYFVVNNFCGH